MNNPPLTCGDVVCLASDKSNPNRIKMTVESRKYGYDNSCDCVWFEGSVLKRMKFDPDALVRTD